MKSLLNLTASKTWLEPTPRLISPPAGPYSADLTLQSPRTLSTRRLVFAAQPGFPATTSRHES
jgi:hypothetical protein